MYKLLLAIRYMMRRRITLLAILSVIICVFMVIVVMTVMKGLVDEFEQKNHEFFSDCIISTESLVGFPYYEDFLTVLDEQDFIEASSPVLSGVAILTRPGTESNHIVNVMGFDIDRHIKVTTFADTIHYHADNPQEVFTPTYKSEKEGCVFGAEMLHYRDPVTGDYGFNQNSPRFQIDLGCFPLTAKGNLAKAATDVVNTKPFTYSDASFSNLIRLDENTVYIRLETLQALSCAGTDKRVSAIYIKFVKDDEKSIAAGTEKIQKLWDDFIQSNADKSYVNLLEIVTVQRWMDYRRATIAPMQKEETMMGVLFLMLGVITVFIVLVVFYMIISHKSKDIGILKSIGISTGSIVYIFLLFAVMIGLIGSFIGAAGGCLFLMKTNQLEDWMYAEFNWQVWDRSVYAIGDIPNEIQPSLVAIVICSAVLACIIGALIPSYQAARRRPSEILQVNQL